MPLGKWIVDKLIAEDKNIKTIVAIYPGRFQPMGAHHAKAYKWLDKKFDDVYVATSGKVEVPKSPFSFTEKRKIINSHGIKKVVQVKNPYKATEILNKYDPETTAAVFMVGEKDASRLGGKFFRPWKGKAEVGYKDGAYTIIAPHVSLKVPGYGEMSGTQIRKALGDPKLDDKQKTGVFKAIFGHTKNYSMIVKKLLNLSEMMESFLSNVDINKILKEASNTAASGKQLVDDGPAITFATFKGYESSGDFYAKQIGWEVVNYILGGAKEVKIIPDRTVDAVTFFPAGVAGKSSPINKTDLKARPAYKMWAKKMSKIAQQVGYKFLNFMGAEAAKEKKTFDKAKIDEPDKEVKNTLNLAERLNDPDIWKPILEKIMLPVEIGDTVLMGKFKNKRVVVKKIEFNEKGDLLINGKSAMRMRIPTKQESIELRKEAEIPKDVLDSFNVKESLNPKLWEGLKLKPEIRKRLLVIAKDFYNSLDITESVKLNDITLTGSIANYNWSKFSDVDLHLRIDFSKVDDDTEFVKNYFLGKKSLWNQKHDIDIYGYPVEVYVENIGDIHVASGLYSILKDKWINEPPKKKVVIDKDDIRSKADGYLAQEEHLKKLMSNKEYDEVIKMVDNIKAKLRKMRQAGLERVGEYSVENLAFKVLRRTPFLQIISDLQTKAYDEKMSMSEGLITEGGAYGHMAHPFDDRGLTFGDFKNIIDLSLQGKLNLESGATEKTDGQNLFITWSDGKLKAARNTGDVKRGGMDIKGVALKFKDRGNIEKAFNYAMNDLSKSIGGLSDPQKDKIFDNGNNWVNMEIMYPASANVIVYDAPHLQFHNVLKYKDGKAIGAVSDGARILAGMIKQINANVQKNFKVIGPQILKVNPNQDFSAKAPLFKSKINKLKSEFGLSDSSTLTEYHQAWWESYVDKNFPGIENTIKMGLVKRWAFNDKSYRLNGKNIPDKELLDKIKNTDKIKVAVQVKKNMLPFEKIFFELGAEVLKNVEGFLAANPDKAVQAIRKQVAQAIKFVRKGGDLKKLNKLKDQLDKIQSMGGFEKIIPSEGLVFIYKGNTYKLTGIFAPINQITGLMNF